MKKIFIAYFLVGIMLMVPIASAVQTSNITKNKTSTLDDEMPEFYVTKKDRDAIDLFIETNFDGEDKTEAINVVDTIILPDYEVDILALADAFQEYTFKYIPEGELNAILDIEDPDEALVELRQLIEDYWGFKDGSFLKNLFQELIDLLIELIKDRLGWVFHFVDDGITLFKNGVSLVYDFIQPAIIAISVLVVAVVNDILSVPQLFSKLLNNLFKSEYDEFMNTIVSFTEEFAGDFVLLIQSVINLVNNQQIKNYLTDVQDFFTWLDNKPWEDKIHITGTVRKNLNLLSGATITVMGQTTTTDSNGNFDFYVDPIPSDDSFPPNQFYGLHNCAITVSQNGKDLKTSARLLSYCFSGGKVIWHFIIIRSRSTISDYKTILMERVNNILLWIYDLFPNLFNIINRVNPIILS